jgi:precorrin-6B methylase 1
LLEKGVENRRAIVMENLTYPDERIVDTDLKSLSGMEGFGLCVMIIKKEQE